MRPQTLRDLLSNCDDPAISEAAMKSEHADMDAPLFLEINGIRAPYYQRTIINEGKPGGGQLPAVLVLQAKEGA
jgi:hypothetical protein